MNLKKLARSFYLLILALGAGALAGLGTMLFLGVITLFFNFLFLGRFSFAYNASMHTPQSAWGAGIILVPALGGLMVIWLIERFAHDERGLSVPEIMHRIRDLDGKISPSVSLAKTLASAISLGSGASIGREGPVIQVGAALSYLFGLGLRLAVEERNILIAAGAAAGTAAVFNAPIAGVMFVIEILLTAVSFFTIVAISLAALVGIYVRNLFIGSAPIFTFQLANPFHSFSAVSVHLIAIVILGILTGLLSVVLIRAVYWAGDLFNRYIKNFYWQHVIGMLLLGLMLYGLMHFLGHYYIDGVSFAAIQDCLNGVMINGWIILLIFFCKFIATCLSLGSGASGGIFSPVLFLGAMLGAMFGMILNMLFPDMGVNPVVLTAAGMGGMVGGTTGAVATAIVLSFELTHDIYSVWPTILTVIVAYVVRRMLCRESVYTLKLVRRGIHC